MSHFESEAEWMADAFSEGDVTNPHDQTLIIPPSDFFKSKAESEETKVVKKSKPRKSDIKKLLKTGCFLR